jgi:hypothetical protein
MKQRVSPYRFLDHREFLREALKEKGYSYRSFAAKHGGIVSFNMLSLCLSKGKSGTESRPMRNFSPELLAQIGGVLKLKDDEIAFLVLLKFENDASVVAGAGGAAYRDAVRRLVREQKAKQSGFGAPAGRRSKSADLIAEFFDRLPSSAKQKLAEKLVSEGKIIIGRHKRIPGVETLNSIIQKLDTLPNFGLF